MRWALGLDLGQVSDPTALAALELSAGSSKRHYACRHLKRFPLGTSYVAIGEQVRDLVSKPPLRGCLLAVDYTGVGRAVVDLLASLNLPCWIVPITITAGGAARGNPVEGWNVPKKELVGVLQVLLQSRRFQVSGQLPLAGQLQHELTNFKAKIVSKDREALEAWRERDHDDLVLACGCAAWSAEKLLPAADCPIGLPEPEKRNVTAAAPEGVFLE